MVTIRPSIESMVDAGVHGLKPYVHSDCGGDVTSPEFEPGLASGAPT